MTKSYLTSGSAIERALICNASVALPHAHYTSPYTRRGTTIHSFLEACSQVGRDAALEQIIELEDRELCAEIDLTGLDTALSLTAEVSFAYNVETGFARELGRGAGRPYDDVTIDEIPCTLDVVGVRQTSGGLWRGLVIDYKSGYRTLRSVDAVVQLDFGALVSARAYNLDLVEVQLAQVYEGFAPHIERRVIEGWEIDAFEAELRERHAKWKELRERFLADGHMPRDFEYSVGPWCEQCGAREWCEAQTKMLRAVLSRDYFDGVMRFDPIPDDALASAWRDVHAAQAVLSSLKGKILGIAATRPVFLGKTADGKERWLRSVTSEGNEKLDGESVYDVVSGLYGEDVAAKATSVVATKEQLGDALKEAVPRGKKASALRDVLEKLRAVPGGITRKLGVSVKELELPPATERLSSDEERPSKT